jgi:two-component system cell cycle sensor histidine kinase/response regulator CckA
MNRPPLSMEMHDHDLQEEDAIFDAPQGGGETILFVEDNDLMREIGTQILEDLGYRVISASNGQEALNAFNKTSDIDLIFTDVVMPEIGGANLLRRIRAAGSQVKAIAVTGHVLAEDLDQLREAGVTSVIRKPYDVDILADAIRKALDTG